MRRRLESLLPAGVLVGFLVAAIVVNLLVASAEHRAVDALEESAVAEVHALATSVDTQYGAQLGSTALVLSNFDLEVKAGSVTDRETLRELVDFFGSALKAGFYLVDLDGRITDGVRLESAAVGDRVGRAGLTELLASAPFRNGTSQYLPLGDGLTSDQQVLVLVAPVFAPGQAPARPGSPPGGPPLGAFVIENPVDPAAPSQLSAVARGETGRYVLFDDGGSVVAANDAAYVTKPVPDAELLSPDADGLRRRDGRVIVVDQLPLVGWHIAFWQDIDEFEEPLAGPLQFAGTILVFGLLVAGFAMTWVLARRLRGARAEQERLAQISATQQELISIVSHELRTPVAGVLGFLETSLDHWDSMDDAAHRSAVARAAANARRLQAMARDVLDTQSLEAGHLVQVLDRVDLAAEVRDAVEAVRGLDGERKFSVDLPDEPVWVSADADRIQQVLANLLDNAAKNAPVVAPIEVSLVGGEGEAVVTVHDHGPGITEEARERIFDKFVRGRGESVTGTGLGLYISRQIITAHGGRIWAESEPGEGATFRFSLPEAATVGPSESSTGEVVTT